MPIGVLVGNGAGYPASFVVSAVILLFFAVGFVAMTPHVPQAGAFYSYVSRGLNRELGLGAAMLALLTYVTIQGAVLGYIGQAMVDLLAATASPPRPGGCGRSWSSAASAASACSASGTSTCPARCSGCC
ncbi:hypothetical protein [Modestobacter sp. VKM Ac-2984]|uniref:hypothetical protein n=1 Tax=Modestobacter sp. VKM Ac-2984 TaxID=3004138 RepID=UPI0022AAAC0D|nr:hypothetical protein [Modestobacter sp. VKM Ac-2984]MCZ2817923.1 hypothetical protein [Modestobacter sp. VKM Ac-2984]